jgi:hypothetical protein
MNSEKGPAFGPQGRWMRREAPAVQKGPVVLGPPLDASLGMRETPTPSGLTVPVDS